ncbi:bifunctional metallophosphatase/5'-nucleotidase [Novosphingobium sp. NPDC080210]|uniref:bifunctional metallophosphatase/5'-nucleotidase n=1 Tax=Novosphingobium sp. NPDC080210 TaxID=3390596 RepID=UPI003D07E174
MIHEPLRPARFARLATLALLPLLAACAQTGGVQSAAHAEGLVTVGILAINDFHGALEPPRLSLTVADGKGGTVQVPAGGGAFLASAIDATRARYAHSLTVSAGDLISASQLASSIYLDEPAIGVANRIGLDFNAVGNHEFDRGREELLRMQNGGCAQHTPRQPCAVEPFKGAQFRFLSASTVTESGKTLFPPYMIRTFGSGARKVEVGVIGLTLKETPSLVSPGGIKGLRFEDEADSINALVSELKREGVDAIVVLIHQGGQQGEGGLPDTCAGFTGEIRPILDRLDPLVDVVVSGHTHRSYICEYGQLNPGKPFLLTSAEKSGMMLTDITLEIDPKAGRVVAKRARQVAVQSLPYTGGRGAVSNSAVIPVFAPRADVAAYVKTYTDAAKAFSSRSAGLLAAPASARNLAMLIADAQLAATRSAGAQIAFMNPFGVRAPLTPGTGGALTFGDIYAVQPFNNTLVTQSMTGAELKAVLEQGFDANGPEQALIPSAGFSYVVDKSRPVGQRIVSMMLNGQPVDPNGMVRVTTNSFLAQGGDAFTIFTAQRTAQIGVSDLEALEAWLKGTTPRAVPSEERVREAP